MNLEIDYYWFFSSVSQSLAALIGIVGMFIVYRLQIQQDNINNAIRNLQEYISRGKPSLLLYLTEAETIEKAYEKIKFIEKSILAERQEIDRSNNLLVSEQINKEGFEKNKEMRQSNITNHEHEKNALQLRINAIIERNKWRLAIKISAFASIIYILVLFVTALGGIIFADFFKEHSNIGVTVIIAFGLMLLAGLLLLLVCCAISLDVVNFGKIRQFIRNRKQSRRVCYGAVE